MKTLLSVLMLFLFIGCDKEDNSPSLPPATQTGARTFGCKVDGKIFVHNDGIINCFYQLIDGENYFSISGKNFDLIPGGVGLGTIQMSIEEGQTYQLLDENPGNAVGDLFYQNILESAQTNPVYTGELSITRLDVEQNIVSGTFWFDVQHPLTGERIEIREGRFDTYFTE
jgi:hypothetical protein